ncbi:hypothetical protein [Zobellia laminariae]|uniref:hypothetical protein n=1 Tax=Zobellia laminariae TaxID=248906 RepID=UPI004057B09D
MKIIFRNALFAALLIAASCGKDNVENSVEKLEQEQIEQEQEELQQAEQTSLDANTVSTNVIIEGGTKNDGMPPTPNEAIAVDLSETSKSAFLGEGFNISLNSEAEIVGAYIQFKTSDGTHADGYYDVNINENDSSGKKVSKSKKKSLFSNTFKTETDKTIDVNFNTEIEPGTFCYEICVYDAAGNISAPTEVCITVESWGGSSEAIGEWTLVKEEIYEEDGSFRTALPEEESCDQVDSISCDNGNTLQAAGNCITINQENLTISADGTYIYEYDDDYKYLITTDSKANCEAIFSENSLNLISKGKWATRTEDNSLVFIEFEYSEGDELEVYEEGYTDRLFDDGALLDGNSLIGSMEKYKIFLEK